MKIFLIISLVVLVLACNSKDKSTTEDSTPNSDILLTPVYEKSKDSIFTILKEISFVAKTDAYIDSFTNHKHNIAFLIDSSDTKELHIKAGYNGNDRFETYYRFILNTETKELKVYDPVSDSTMLVKDFENSL